MGSPSSNQATLTQLFPAISLMHRVIPQNPDSTNIFGVVPGVKCILGNFKINKNVETSEVIDAEASDGGCSARD